MTLTEIPFAEIKNEERREVKKKSSPSLQQRITWFTGGAFFFVGIVMLILVNFSAPLFITTEIAQIENHVIREVTNANGNLVTVIDVTPAPDGYVIGHDEGFFKADPLFTTRILSVIGFIFLVLLGVFAARIVAKSSLQPLNRISETAKEISIERLDQRLNHEGADDAIKTLADSFDRMLDRLKKNFDAQGDFISNLSHELRTPLTSLRLDLEMLNADSESTIADYKEFTESAEDSLIRLEKLVVDFLLLAKGEKEIHLVPVNLEVLFQEIDDELRQIAESKKIAFIIGGSQELEVLGDRILLNRAFSNLIENGIKYTHEGGMVEVQSTRQGHNVLITVKDDGVGIPTDKLEMIFERFFRIDEGYLNPGGNGLGLSITGKIVDLHNGKINVKSEIGKGTTVEVLLPCTNCQPS